MMKNGGEELSKECNKCKALALLQDAKNAVH
jgi:hypothetical protein